MDRYDPKFRRGAEPEAFAAIQSWQKETTPMPIEGREDEVVVLTVIKRFASYNEHDVAAFLPEQAQKLIDDGFAVEGGGADDPPVNLTVPHAGQEGDQLICTMGEWTGDPSDYAYQWQSDGVDVATGTPYPLTLGDTGKTFTCLVTATNAAGSTTAPPTTGVVVTEPTGEATTGYQPVGHRPHHGAPRGGSAARRR